MGRSPSWGQRRKTTWQSWHLSLTLSDVFSRLRDNIKMALQKEHLGLDKGICVKYLRNKTGSVHCGQNRKKLM